MLNRGAGLTSSTSMDTLVIELRDSDPKVEQQLLISGGLIICWVLLGVGAITIGNRHGLLIQLLSLSFACAWVVSTAGIPALARRITRRLAPPVYRRIEITPSALIVEGKSIPWGRIQQVLTAHGVILVVLRDPDEEVDIRATGASDDQLQWTVAQINAAFSEETAADRLRVQEQAANLKNAATAASKATTKSQS